MYKKKKQFDNRYLLILIILVISIALVILAIALKNDRKLNPVEKVIKDTGTFTIRIVKFPFDFVKNKLDENHKKNEVYKKYKKLKEKSDNIDSIISANDNLKDEVKKLKESLKLNTALSDRVLVNATVIYRNIGYWYDEITIDKGSKDGIEKDMAVVTSKGLIGRTSKVSRHSSSVKLLSNDNMNNKISVKIKVKDDYIYGLISKYDSKRNVYTVEGISENVEIPDGADVVTTGMGAIFPSGLLVGNVEKITTDNYDLSKVIEVKSSVNYDDIDYVTVVKREAK
ncbi:MAG: rod shape-determining protein MreC [Bacilli bacterium]|nr:rod shape-determining protein MreC [Bacilli bacterium]